VVDTRTGQVLGAVLETAGVHGVAVAADLGLGFASDGRADAVTVFDLATLKLRATIAVGHAPDAILYDAASHRVMTFNAKSRDVTVIDAAKGVVVATVPAGGKPEFADAGAGGLVWFNVEDTAEMAVLDPMTARIVKRIALAPCEGPSGLAYDGHANHYAVCDNGQMAVVDADGHVIARPAIGAGPDGVVWMDGAAWSANGQDGTISVVRETRPGRFETVETIVTALGARTIAADPATHRLYLPTAQFEPAAQGQRRKGVAGSLRVLVLEKR
ncbi:MAG: YncE family protein, partial [Burkholderiales bacterium]|nr:YncE family protein [Burkholderiales bacterium]